jgi:hypothetical protein
MWWRMASCDQTTRCSGCGQAIAARHVCLGREAPEACIDCEATEPPVSVTRYFHPACAPLADDDDLLTMPGASALREDELLALIEATAPRPRPAPNPRVLTVAISAKRPRSACAKASPPPLRPETFSLDDLAAPSAALAYLEREGYLVIRDVLPAEVCAEGLALFWDAMLRLNPALDPRDRGTWTNANMPGLLNIGIVSFYGLCQSDFAWHVRAREEIARVFAAVHAVPADELVASMDALALRFDARNACKTAWLHVDQLSHLPAGELRSVQGAFNFLAVGELDAGLVVVPRSHVHPALPPAEAALKRGHYCPLPAAHCAFGRERKLLLDANCLCLWDSRLVHANTSELRNRPPDPDGAPQLNRLNVFVCMMPRALRSADALAKKRAAYRAGRGTDHWAVFARLKPADARWPAQRKPWVPLRPRLEADGRIPPERDALL